MFSGQHPMTRQAQVGGRAGELTDFDTPIKVAQTLLTVCRPETDTLVALCGALLGKGSTNAWRSRW